MQAPNITGRARPSFGRLRRASRGDSPRDAARSRGSSLVSSFLSVFRSVVLDRRLSSLLFVAQIHLRVGFVFFLAYSHFGSWLGGVSGGPRMGALAHGKLAN